MSADQNNAKKLNQILVSLFNSVLKMEDAVLKESGVHNLSITEIHTLEAIGEGRPKTMTHVAASLQISVSTLTAAINKLVNKGYVNRFRIPEDRRIVKLELTETGATAVREHETFHLAMIEDALTGLSPEEAELFIRSLENVNEFMLMRRINPLIKKEEISLSPDRIYQGGMGIGISGSRLATAVAICGGVGIISATHPGYGEEDFYENPVKANVRALQRQLKEALAEVRRAEGKGLVGVNVMCSDNDYETYVRAAVEAGAQVIVSGGGVPTALPGICKGSNVKLIPIVSSSRGAAVIIKNWTKKHNRTPDAVIYDGPLAGGHLGFKEDQMGLAEEKFYRTIGQIKAELLSFPECRLIVGGGIYDRQDAQKALASGADGVELGTRFVTTEECDAPESFKEAYLSCRESDIGLIKSPLGMPCRVIRNALTMRLSEGQIPISRCINCLMPCNPGEADFCISEALICAAKGDVENGLLLCGAKAYKSKRIETVREIFEELTKN